MANGKRCVNIDRNKVKGLLVGINYRGTSSELGGCINDVLTVRKLILSTYPNAKLEIMTDDTPVKPTRDNILNQLKKLVNEAKAGDLLIFDYSGHGSQVPDLHGDEADGMDETICPIDFMKRRVITYQNRRYVVDSQITNDEINDIITQVPKGAKFLMLSDSCHSGTIGQLHNDFLNYQGPNVWPNVNPSTNKDNLLEELVADLVDHNISTTANISHLTNNANTNTANIPYVTTHASDATAVSLEPLSETEVGIADLPTSNNTTGVGMLLPQNPVKEFQCNTTWIYVPPYNGTAELWITPQDYNAYQEFNYQKHVLKLSNSQVPPKLINLKNQTYSCITYFTQYPNKEFVISAPSLEVFNLKIKIGGLQTNEAVNLSKNINASFNSINSSCNSHNSNGVPRIMQLPNGEQIVTDSQTCSHYDPDTGKHYHVNYTTGEKNSLKMRSHACCTGGELRVISGCQENQTSADTGKNGACTLAFMDTVIKYGGLEKFLVKVFSHNIEDLRLIQDHINSFLIKFGFTQQSMLSWDHATSSRALNYAPGFFTQYPGSNLTNNPINVGTNLLANFPVELTPEPILTVTENTYTYKPC